MAVKDKSYTLHVDCACHSPDHICRFSFYDWGDREEPEMFAAVQLNNFHPWYYRAWIALKYVFKGTTAGWEEVLFRHEDVKKLANMFKDYEDTRDAYLKSYEESK